MKTEEIINLDYRKEKNREIIQKVLRKIKPLSKFSEEEDVPLEALEKLVGVLTRKYEIQPQWISLNFTNPVLGIYSCGVKTSDTHEWLGTCYGTCLYELFAKLAIKMFSEVRSENIPLKKLTKEETEREKLAKRVDAQEDDE